MSFISESLTIGLLLTLVFGALFFYIYSRVTYVEKRIGLMENILLDIKVGQEQMPSHVLPQVPPNVRFQEVAHMPQPMHQMPHQMPPQMPHQMPQMPPFIPSRLEEEVQVEEVVQEVEDNSQEVYASILEDAHRSTGEFIPEDITIEPVPSDSSDSLARVTVNYESMTKDELVEIAKQKGLRTGNRPGREKLIQLIRKSEELPGTLQSVDEPEV